MTSGHSIRATDHGDRFCNQNLGRDPGVAQVSRIRENTQLCGAGLVWRRQRGDVIPTLLSQISGYSTVKMKPGAKLDQQEKLSPRPRYFPVFEGLGLASLLFGGYGEDASGKQFFGDTWWYQDDCWERVSENNDVNSNVGRAPQGRYGAMSILIDDAVIVFGGFGGQHDLADVWHLSSKSKQWTCLWNGAGTKGPSRRYTGAMAPISGGFVVYGGRSRASPKDNYRDLWYFSLEACKWTQIRGHAQHADYSLADTPAYHAKSASTTNDGGLWIFGGEGARGHVSDFWRLDLASLRWELVQSSRPDDPVFW
jgi:hypothetical protein